MNVHRKGKLSLRARRRGKNLSRSIQWIQLHIATRREVLGERGLTRAERRNRTLGIALIVFILGEIEITTLK
jgi:hypothetical protein